MHIHNLNYQHLVEARLNIILNEGDQITFGYISTRKAAIKILDLSIMTEERIQHKLGKDKERFVIAVQKGDQLFAHMGAQAAKNLDSSKPVTLDGKNVECVILSDEDYDELVKIGEAFSEQLKIDAQLKKTADQATLQAEHKTSIPANVKNAVSLFNLLMKMEEASDKIKHKILKSWIDNLQAVEEAKKEDAKELREKLHTLEIRIIQKEIEKREILNEEINRQLLHKTITSSPAA